MQQKVLVVRALSYDKNRIEACNHERRIRSSLVSLA